MTTDSARRHTLTGFPDAAIHLMRALEQNRQQIGSDQGLTSMEMKTLFRIAEAGSITPKQLAESLSVTNGAITGISTRLVEAGLLQRVAHPKDRRSVFLELTGPGHHAMVEIHADFNQMVTEATAGITAEELAVTTETLRRVTNAIRARLQAEQE